MKSTLLPDMNFGNTKKIAEAMPGRLAMRAQLFSGQGSFAQKVNEP